MALPDPLKICSYCIRLCQSHPYLCGTVTVSGNCRSQIHEGVYLFQGFLIYPDLTCSPCCCHNLCLACVYLQTEFPPASFNLLVNVCNSSTVFAIRMISSAYLRFVIRLPPICTPPSRVSLITISARMLNRVRDSTHPCLTPLLILHSVDIVPATFTLAFCLLHHAEPGLLRGWPFGMEWSPVGSPVTS